MSFLPIILSINTKKRKMWRKIGEVKKKNRVEIILKKMC